MMPSSPPSGIRAPYRSLKLFDAGDDRVESVEVTKADGSKFALAEVDGKKVRLTSPVAADADAAKAEGLFRNLAGLEATEYVYDPREPNELTAIGALLGGFGASADKLAAAAYGTDAPAFQVRVNFVGPVKVEPRTLNVGKKRDGKDEYYAWFAGTPNVFAVGKAVPDALEGGSLGLLPLQKWTGSGFDVTKIEVTRGTEPPFALERKGGLWKLTAPFAADLDPTAADAIANALATVKAERYEAHSAADPAKYGFDKPTLKVAFTSTERKAVNGKPEEETKQRTLVIGKPEGEMKPGRFARLDGPDSSVFVVPEALVKAADKPVLDLLDRTILTADAAAASRLEVTGPEGNVVLKKDGADWKPEGAAFPVDRPTVDALLRQLGSLTAEKFADFGDKVDLAKFGLDAPAKPAAVTVTAGDKTTKVEIGKAVEGSTGRYARVEGSKGVAVLAAGVAKGLTKSRLEFVERGLLKFDSFNLLSIKRVMDGKELELKSDAGSWTVAKPSSQPADGPGVDELAERLGSLRAERIADVELKDAAKYGLDKPSAVVTLEYTAKGGKTETKILKLGKPVDDKVPDGERFANVEGSTTVGVLPAWVSKKLTADPIKFRDRGLASFVSADKVVLARGGKDATFVKEGGAWKMKEPVAAEAEDQALRELHDALAKLRADEFVEDKPGDLKKYGLDKPERWRLFNGDKEVLNLLVGGREKEGGGFRAYAKLDKGDAVVLLDMPLTAKLSAEYRKRSLWPALNVPEASKIVVKTADGTGSFTLEKGPAGWREAGKPDAKLNAEAVNEFLDAFAELKAAKYVEHKPAEGLKLYGLDPPQRTITVETTTGQKRTLLVGRLDDAKRAYAKVEEKDRTDVVALSEADTAKLTRNRAAFDEKKK